MKRFFTAVALMLAVANTALAVPVTGTYTSTDLGGQLLPGRASTHRPGINSGLPHVIHGQSWDGTTLGAQWELRCPTNNVGFTVQDLRNVSGTGVVIYTSDYSGGQMEFFPGPGPWGDGIATLSNTHIVSTVQFVNFIPVASVVNGNTSGVFAGGCALTFGIANGFGAGETTSLNPAIVKPSNYPSFLDATCSPAAPGQQFGTWGSVISITMQIDCAVPTRPSTWGALKTTYR